MKTNAKLKFESLKIIQKDFFKRIRVDDDQKNHHEASKVEKKPQHHKSFQFMMKNVKIRS